MKRHQSTIQFDSNPSSHQLEYPLNLFPPLFCLSIARMRSKSLKSDGWIGLEMEVISIPRLFEAALILGSARLPFNNNKNITNQSLTQLSNSFKVTDIILMLCLIT